MKPRSNEKQHGQRAASYLSRLRCAACGGEELLCQLGRLIPTGLLLLRAAGPTLDRVLANGKQLPARVLLW